MLDWLCWEKPSKSWSNRFGLENLRLRTGKQPSLSRFLWVLISSGLNSKGSQSVQKRKLIIESLSGWWCHIAFDVHVLMFFGLLWDNDCQLTCLATCLYVTVLCCFVITFQSFGFVWGLIRPMVYHHLIEKRTRCRPMDLPWPCRRDDAPLCLITFSSMPVPRRTLLRGGPSLFSVSTAQRCGGRSYRGDTKSNVRLNWWCQIWETIGAYSTNMY